MKLSDVVNAAAPLRKLIAQDLPLRTAWELTKLVDRLNPMLRFYGEQAPSKSSEDRQALLDMEMEELQDVFPLALSLELDLRLSACDIKLLSPFVAFREAEG